jgi:hypothetical protein
MTFSPLDGSLPKCLRLNGHNNMATWCTLCIYSDGKYHFKVMDYAIV